MTSTEMVAAIASILGATGLSGIAIAYFGYRTELAKGRKTDPTPSVAIAVGKPIASGAELELVTNALTLLHGAINKLVALMEQDVKRHEVDDEVDRKIAERELKLLTGQLRGQGDR